MICLELYDQDHAPYKLNNYGHIVGGVAFRNGSTLRDETQTHAHIAEASFSLLGSVGLPYTPDRVNERLSVLFQCYDELIYLAGVWAHEPVGR
jgi:hypothetical protein